MKGKKRSKFEDSLISNGKYAQPDPVEASNTREIMFVLSI